MTLLNTRFLLNMFHVQQLFSGSLNGIMITE